MNINEYLTIPYNLDVLESRRITILRTLIADLAALEINLLNEKAGCSRVCRSMILGDLLQATKGGKLYPRPSPPFSTLVLQQVFNSLRTAPSSNCFSSLEDSVDTKRSDQWCRAVLAGPQQNSIGYPFSNGNASQPNAAKQQQKPHTGHQCQSTPHIHGSSTGSFGAAATEKNKLPQILVRHHCGLTELMAPIISKAEASTTGLDLPNYLGP